MILLPLRSASLSHKNSPKMPKKIHEMRPVGRKERLIDLKIFLVELLSCSCDFCGCCLKMHIYFSLFCALNIKTDYYFNFTEL